MGLQEDLDALRREKELDAERTRQRSAIGHQTERRPGERKVSLEEDLAALRNASGTKPPPTTTRNPWGATVAGIGAGIALAPLGPAVAMAGASLASGIGEAGQNLAELAYDSPTKPRDTPELLGRVGKEMMLGTVAEGAGRVLNPLAKRMNLLFFSPRIVSPEATEAMRFITQENIPTHLLPAKATESFGIDMLHNVAEHSFTGGGTMSRFIKEEAGFMSALAEDMVKKIGPHVTPEQAGEILVQSAEGNLKQARHPATVIYNSIKTLIEPKEVIKKVPVEVETGILGPGGKPLTRTIMEDKTVLAGGLRTGFKDIKAFIKGRADVQDRLANIGSDITGGTLLQRFSKLSDKPYVSDLMEFRTTIRGIKEGLEAGITTKKDPQLGLLRNLESKLTKRIDLALRHADPALAQAKRKADMIYRDGSLRYNNKVIRQLGRLMDMERTGAPERVVKAVFAPHALTRMQTIKRALTPEAWQKVARQGMDMILSNSTKDGAVVGTMLERNLLGKGGLGGRGLVEAVGPIEAQRWIKFANALKAQQQRQGAGEGSMLIQLKQPGAILEGAGALMAGAGLADEESNGLTAAGALILGLPYISAKIMTNARASSALIHGMNMKRTSPSAAGIIARLVGALVPRTVEAQPPRPAPIPTVGPQVGLSHLPPSPALQR